jgi:hypothetical protein
MGWKRKETNIAELSHLQDERSLDVIGRDIHDWMLDSTKAMQGPGQSGNRPQKQGEGIPLICNYLRGEHTYVPTKSSGQSLWAQT